MKTQAFLCAACLVCVAAIAGRAETMLNLKMGPAWPKALRSDNAENGITAWEPSIEIGTMFNRTVGIGFDAEFQWKRRLVDSTYNDTLTGGNIVPITVIDKVERFYLFPPCFFLCVDPVPDLIVHPVIKGQVGMTLLYYKNQWLDDTNGDGVKEKHYSEDSGKHGHLYYGVFGKVGVDALYDLGETVSVFAGFEFQFGNARHKKDNSESEYYTKQIYGPGIRMGFSFLM
jgi:hypothetical protein